VRTSTSGVPLLDEPVPARRWTGRTGGLGVTDRFDVEDDGILDAEHEAVGLAPLDDVNVVALAISRALGAAVDDDATDVAISGFGGPDRPGAECADEGGHRNCDRGRQHCLSKY